MAKDPVADLPVEVPELRRQIGVVDADITLVNERLNESQSMCSTFLIFIGNIKRSIMLMWYAWTTGRAAVVKALEGGTCPSQGTSPG